jgi:hypothetical protein
MKIYISQQRTGKHDAAATAYCTSLGVLRRVGSTITLLAFSFFGYTLIEGSAMQKQNATSSVTKSALTFAQLHHVNTTMTSHEPLAESSPKSSAMRVAVCITGHVRSFYQPSVHKSIARNLIEPLRKEAGVLDVFFHVGLADEPRNKTVRALSKPGETIAAMNLFNPVSVTYFKHTRRNVTGQANCHPGQVQLANIYPYSLLRASQCMDQIVLHENRINKQYDWIVKTRPDVALGDPITPLSKLRRDIVQLNQHIPG